MPHLAVFFIEVIRNRSMGKVFFTLKTYHAVTNATDSYLSSLIGADPAVLVTIWATGEAYFSSLVMQVSCPSLFRYFLWALAVS